MKIENSLLMRQAREALAGKWGLAVGTMFVYVLIGSAIQYIPKAGPILFLLISGPMTLGLVIFSLSLSRNQNPRFEQIFEGFKRFGVSLAAYLLVMLFTLLWTLLLIIPGIIAALSYSMTFYILVDDASVGAREAIKRSKKMMMGNKWKLFCLGLRFIGWMLLCIPTLGIGFFWLIPYIQISNAKFYDDIKNSGVVA
ncbi:MAG: DUF975 family protein [Candidatus Paceibacterota bacterium]|jgi:uncharacterized membrane protein